MGLLAPIRRHRADQANLSPDQARVGGLGSEQGEPPIGIEPMTYALRVRRSDRLS